MIGNSQYIWVYCYYGDYSHEVPVQSGGYVGCHLKIYPQDCSRISCLQYLTCILSWARRVTNQLQTITDNLNGRSYICLRLHFLTSNRNYVSAFTPIKIGHNEWFIEQTLQTPNFESKLCFLHMLQWTVRLINLL